MFPIFLAWQIVIVWYFEYLLLLLSDFIWFLNVYLTTSYSGICLILVRKKMKCLLCFSKFKDQKDLLNHYVTYHNVHKNNWFFQKLFQIKDKSLLKRCLGCDKFLVTEKQKTVHNFLKHYEDDKTIPFEEKLLDVLRLALLTIYSIEFRKHQNFWFKQFWVVCWWFFKKCKIQI